MTLRLVAVTLLAVVAVVVGACASGSSTADSAPGPPIGVDADLGAALLPQPPAGFTLVTDPARTGTIHIEDVVSLEDAAGQAGANLAAFGFLDGYQKTFAGPTPDEGLYATIEQYTSTDGATQRYTDAAARADGLEGRTGFDVATIPDAHGSDFTGAAQGLPDTRLIQVLFRFENVVVRIERTTTASSGVTPQDLIAIAEQQHEVLEALP